MTLVAGYHRGEGGKKVGSGRGIGGLVLGGEDVLEILNQSIGDLLRGSGVGSIRIGEMGNPIFVVSLDYALKKKEVFLSPRVAHLFSAH